MRKLEHEITKDLNTKQKVMDAEITSIHTQVYYFPHRILIFPDQLCRQSPKRNPQMER